MGNDFIVMIHCLTYLAIHHDNRYSSKELAFNACSNPAIVRKLMSLAVKKGWVSTAAGKQGGFRPILPSKFSNGKNYGQTTRRANPRTNSIL